MARIYLTDGSGNWFDDDAATAFEESTRWNGNNHISQATGSQWEHETLYRTKSGKWVIHHSSQWQGSSPSYRQVGDQEAADWLLRNEYSDDEIPEELLALVKPHIDATEL